MKMHLPRRKKLAFPFEPYHLVEHIHSDRGGQYVSNAFHELISLWHIRPNMSRASDPYDNAFTESFWSRLKAELIGGTLFSVEDAQTEIFEYIEMYHNRVRKHSSLGYISPEHFGAIR